jgi:recombinational DNA repair ATPase RecF
MKANTQKFLNTYNKISEVENMEVDTKREMLNQEKMLKTLNSQLYKYGSKITESEFEHVCSELCCSWEEFQDCYIN